MTIYLASNGIYYKIGHTNDDVQNRVNSIKKYQNSNKFELIDSFTTSYNDYKIEQLLLEILRGFKSDSEYFQHSQKVVDSFIQIKNIYGSS